MFFQIAQRENHIRVLRMTFIPFNKIIILKRQYLLAAYKSCSQIKHEQRNRILKTHPKLGTFMILRHTFNSEGIHSGLTEM